MRCLYCLQEAEFKCGCQQPYMCGTHLVIHIKNLGKHEFEVLNINLEQSRLQNLKSKSFKRIQKINEAEKLISSTTESLIKTIEKANREAINGLDNLRKNYFEILEHKKFCTSELPKIEEIEKTELDIKTVEIDQIMNEIEKSHGRELVKYLEKRSVRYKKEEQERRRKEEEKRKKEDEERCRKEEEERLKKEKEVERRKKEEERSRKEEEERLRKNEEEKRKIEEQRRRKEEEDKEVERRKKEEERRRKEEEDKEVERRKKEEERRRKEEEDKEVERRKKEEEERRRKEEQKVEVRSNSYIEMSLKEKIDYYFGSIFQRSKDGKYLFFCKLHLGI